MHADTLYHRMLDQESAIEAAKKEGKPIPEFAPILSSRPKFTNPSGKDQKSQVSSSQDDGTLKASDLGPSVQAKFKERLAGLSPEEQALEERAIKAEIQAGEEVAGNLGEIWKKQEEERRRRKEEGRETIADKLQSWFR